MTPVANVLDDASCNTELFRLADLDDDTRFRDLISLANRHDVVFYPINPSGLRVFDTTLAQSTKRTRPRAPVSAVDLRWHRDASTPPQ
jgi:hypothetical protein